LTAKQKAAINFYPNFKWVRRFSGSGSPNNLTGFGNYALKLNFLKTHFIKVLKEKKD